MVADRSVTVRLRADVSDFQRKLAAASGTAKGFADRLDAADSRMANLVQTGLALAPALVPIGGLAVPAVAGLVTQLGAAGAAAGVTLLAFKGVGGALDALNKYQLAPTAENFAAMQLKMQQLGPDGQKFVRTLQGMRPQLQELQNQARAGLFPGATEGLDELLKLLPQAERLIGHISTTTGDLFAEAGDNLNDPRWVKFFDYLDREASPTLEAMGKTLGNVVEGLANMIMAFDPLSDDFTHGMLNMSRAFNQWTQGLDSSEGFQKFLSYLEDTGPEALQTLGSLADALVAFVTAAAPVGKVTLPIIKDLADGFTAIADSPIGPLLITTAAAVGVLGRSLALLRAVGLRGGEDGKQPLLGRILNVDDAKKALPAIREYTAASKELLVAHEAARVANVKYLGTLRAYNAANEVTGGRASQKGMAAAAYELVAAENKQEAAAKRVAAAEEARGRAISKTLSGAGKAAGVVAGLAVATSGAADQIGLANTASMGLMGTIAGPWGAALGAGVGVVMDLAAANNDLTTAMDNANRAGRDGVQVQQQRQAYRELQNEIADATGKVNDFYYLFQTHGDKGPLEYFKSLPGALKGFGIEFTGGTKEAQSALDALDAKMGGTSDLAGLLGQSFAMTGRQASIAAGNVSSLSASLSVLAGWLDKRAALRGFQEALDNLSAGLKKNSHAWSDTTKEGRANLDLLDATARGIVQVATQMKNPTVRANFLQGARKDLAAMAEKFPGAKAQIRGLLHQLDALGLTHAKPKVDVDTKNADGKVKHARDQLHKLDREHANPKVDSNTRPVEGKWQRLFGISRRLDGLHPNPRVDSDTRPAQSKWNQLFGMGHRLDAFVANPKVHADTSQAFSAINAVRYALAALHDKTISIHTVQTTSYLSKRAGIPMPSAEGSTVPKDGGTYADRYLYLLAPGEEVISNRAGQADRWRPLLKAINAGRLAGGGTVRGLASGGTATATAGSGQDSETAKKLKSLHHALDGVTKALKAENAELDKLRQRQQQVRQAVMDGLRSDLFAAPSDVWAAGAGNPLGVLRGDIARTRTFNAARDRLVRKGVHGMALQEILENPDSALMMSRMSRQQLAEYERLYARRQKLTRAAAVGATGALGIDRHVADAVHEIRELRHEVNHIQKAIHHKTQQDHKSRQDAAQRTADGVNGAARNGHRKGHHG